MSPRYSLVIPLYNEAGNILEVVEVAVGVLAAQGKAFEIVLVNDASTDGTGSEIAAAARRWPACRELRLPAHAGQAAALHAGLNLAQGERILTMDGDGQNDSRDFPALLELVESGRFDLACGWRTDRQDTLLRRMMSRLANTVRQAVLHDGIHDAGCQLRVMRREVLSALRPMELLQAFIPALAVAAGFRVGEMPVRHHPRRHGRSKYGLGRLWWRPALEMLRLRRTLARGKRA
ncbi:MAG TPA: glycosyltransferase family 2 protein [Opitutaceae bacterium]|jgi:glycosyltransferase involved in cell wall biosynthesis